eukprot:5662054-Alexandrium_andersonii.AAC.1
MQLRRKPNTARTTHLARVSEPTMYKTYPCALHADSTSTRTRALLRAGARACTCERAHARTCIECAH